MTPENKNFNRNESSEQHNDYNSPSHYNISRREFAHGQSNQMTPDNTEEFRPTGYVGRDYEQNVGYRESYRELDDERSIPQASAYRDNRGKGPRSYQRSDNRITEDICERLSDDPFIDASEIQVEVNQGQVILQGRVNDRETKRRTEDLCAHVSGVKVIENHLNVDTNSGQPGNTGTAPSNSGSRRQ